MIGHEDIEWYEDIRTWMWTCMGHGDKRTWLHVLRGWLTGLVLFYIAFSWIFLWQHCARSLSSPSTLLPKGGGGGWQRPLKKAKKGPCHFLFEFVKAYKGRRRCKLGVVWIRGTTPLKLVGTCDRRCNSQCAIINVRVFPAVRNLFP